MVSTLTPSLVDIGLQTGCPQTAVLLTAGPPAATRTGLDGRSSSAMVPVNGRPAVHWTLSYLAACGVQSVVIGARPDDSRLRDFVDVVFGSTLSVSWVDITDDQGPGGTLARCLAHVPSGDNCVVVLGDTIFRFPELPRAAFDGTFVLTGQVDDEARWCLADVKDGRVTGLLDQFADGGKDRPALIGVYVLRDCDPARQALSLTLERAGRAELRDALEPYVADGSLQAWAAGEWFDCGHPDTLSSTRRHLLPEREFNSLEVDDIRGTITKRSRNVAKFLDEVRYYSALPSDVGVFFPRVVSSSDDPSDPSLTLEYYGYPTLSELWTFEELDTRRWHRIFTRLVDMLDCMAAYPGPRDAEAVLEFLWTKTVDRLEMFAASSPTAAALVSADELYLNGTVLAGWNRLAADAKRAVAAASATGRSQIIHGDLCFPNVLYDPSSHLCKFIDPRGSFTHPGVYGDRAYDVAKLLHSVDGGYDFLIHDMYRLSGSDQSWDLEQFVPANHAAVLDAFAEVFAADDQGGRLRLIESMLFLSMCPLHADQPRRQVAMYLIGLRLLNEVLT